MHEHPIEKALSVCVEDIELSLQGHQATEWADFLLNPRRLRGSDFLMRWSQGYWSEERLLAAVQATENFYAIPYGPSGVAPKKCASLSCISSGWKMRGWVNRSVPIC